jgi:hypothetical protein
MISRSRVASSHRVGTPLIYDRRHTATAKYIIYDSGTALTRAPIIYDGSSETVNHREPADI